MAATIGTAKCLNTKCGREIPAGESEKGALTLTCAWCGLQAFAKKGTKAHGALSALVVRDPAEAPAVPAAAAAPGAPAGPKKPDWQTSMGVK